MGGGRVVALKAAVALATGPNDEEEDGPGVDAASNRGEYQEYLMEVKSGGCVRLTTLPPS